MVNSDEETSQVEQNLYNITKETCELPNAYPYKISGTTKVTGLIGHPVSHSLSPKMQNAAFHYCGLDICYLPFDVCPDELEKAMVGIRALGLLGVNITIPHKVRAAEIVDELSPEAHASNAINTVINYEGRLIGYNTDIQGILDAIKHDVGMSLKSKTAVVAGAGGAARAAIYAMAKAGCSQIVVVNRTFSKAFDLCRIMKQAISTPDPKKSGHDKTEPVENCPELTPGKLCELHSIANSLDFDIFINATPLGLVERTNPFPELINCKGRPLVCDLTYTPKGTPLILEASCKGFPTIDGRSILVWQGAESFELWTGQKAPVEAMKKAVSLYPSEERRDL